VARARRSCPSASAPLPRRSPPARRGALGRLLSGNASLGAKRNGVRGTPRRRPSDDWTPPGRQRGRRLEKAPGRGSQGPRRSLHRVISARARGDGITRPSDFERRIQTDVSQIRPRIPEFASPSGILYPPWSAEPPEGLHLRGGLADPAGTPFLNRRLERERDREGVPKRDERVPSGER